jgi:hypothetical protein
MVKIVEHPGAGKFWVRGPWISRTSFRLGKIVNLLDQRGETGSSTSGKNWSPPW